MCHCNRRLLYQLSGCSNLPRYPTQPSTLAAQCDMWMDGKSASPYPPLPKRINSCHVAMHTFRMRMRLIHLLPNCITRRTQHCVTVRFAMKWMTLCCTMSECLILINSWTSGINHATYIFNANGSLVSLAFGEAITGYRILWQPWDKSQGDNSH